MYKFLFLLLLFACICIGKPTHFNVVAFYSASVEPDHVLFANDALRFFPAIARRDGFTFEATTDWNKLNDEFLKRYQVVLWLDDSPHTAAQRAAFERYMEHGGGWMGFHASGYNDKDTGWPWFVNFLGGVFYDNSWPPLPAKLRLDAVANPVTSGIEKTFLAPSNEWYGWRPNPRSNSAIRVLVTLDPSNYPIGLKDVLTGGDVPVVWTNTNYRMIYMNMGHGNKILSTPMQNRLMENATLWLGSGSNDARKWRSRTTAVSDLTSVEISPRAVVVNDNTHKAYAVDTPGGNVTVTGAGNRSAPIKVGREPVGLAINAVRNRVYVANQGSGTVSVIDGSTDTVITTVEVGGLPYVIVSNSVSDKVYVSHTFSNTLTEIDAGTNTAAQLKAGVQADSIAVNTRTNKLYLLGYEGKSITVLDGASNSFGKVEGGLHLWGSAINEATNKLYVANSGSGIALIIDGETGTAQTVKTGKIPCAVAVDPLRNKAYVVDHGSDTVTVIDGATSSVLATVQVGSGPQAIAVDSKRDRIYVANTHDNTVSVIDGSKNRVVATEPAGGNPFALAVDEGSGAVYAADMTGANMALVTGSMARR